MPELVGVYCFFEKLRSRSANWKQADLWSHHMKQLLNRLINKILASIKHALLGIICLHEMGISPSEADNFLHVRQIESSLGKEEKGQMARIAHLTTWQEPDS